MEIQRPKKRKFIIETGFEDNVYDGYVRFQLVEWRNSGGYNEREAEYIRSTVIPTVQEIQSTVEQVVKKPLTSVEDYKKWCSELDTTFHDKVGCPSVLAVVEDEDNLPDVECHDYAETGQALYDKNATLDALCPHVPKEEELKKVAELESKRNRAWLAVKDLTDAVLQTRQESPQLDTLVTNCLSHWTVQMHEAVKKLVAEQAALK